MAAAAPRPPQMLTPIKYTFSEKHILPPTQKSDIFSPSEKGKFGKKSFWKKVYFGKMSSKKCRLGKMYVFWKKSCRAPTPNLTPVSELPPAFYACIYCVFFNLHNSHNCFKKSKKCNALNSCSNSKM